MSGGPEERETLLKGFGLARVDEGEQADAWTAFWGAEMKLEE